MLHFDDIVFGPIRSRRLGSSLGVNILPAKGKLCNFDCIYCECGWNKDGLSDKRFPVLQEVETALRSRLESLSKEGVVIDSITFSGNGEPTLNPDFPKIIDVTLRLRDEYCPSARISVLSNATMLDREGVFEALKRVDNPILKIDGASDGIIATINRSAASYKLENVVKALQRFEGQFILQTMFLRSPDFDLSAEENLSGWRNLVRRLGPREVMVYTIDRETPDKSLGKYSVEEMTEFVRPLIDEGFNVQIRG